MPTRGSYWDGEIVTGKGGSHGAPWLYDRTVPMLVRAPGVGQGQVVSAPVDFTAFAGVVASLVRIDPRSPGEILSQLTARVP